MRTEALGALITVILRAATLVSQSLLVGGIVFRRWAAAAPAARGTAQMDDPPLARLFFRDRRHPAQLSRSMNSNFH